MNTLRSKVTQLAAPLETAYLGDVGPQSGKHRRGDAVVVTWAFSKLNSDVSNGSFLARWWWESFESGGTGKKNIKK